MDALLCPKYYLRAYKCRNFHVNSYMANNGGEMRSGVETCIFLTERQMRAVKLFSGPSSKVLPCWLYSWMCFLEGCLRFLIAFLFGATIKSFSLYIIFYMLSSISTPLYFISWTIALNFSDLAPKKLSIPVDFSLYKIRRNRIE